MPFGSSPYTRGTPSAVRSPRLRARFIPVHTGNSNLCLNPDPKYSVHPRTHGELANSTNEDWQYFGSSPYTRGTLAEDTFVFGTIRFIPVHTGNSLTGVRPERVWTVHPRTHGELEISFVSRANLIGSSPYTRGTPAHRKMTRANFRFIPVHTGNSPILTQLRKSRPVHPRTHGEL